MNAAHSISLAALSPDARVAAVRSVLYQILARALAAPDASLCKEVATGALRTAIATACRALPYPVSWRGNLFPEPEELEVAYTGLFLVEPVCPLREAAHAAGRQSGWGELVRFYDFFGLKLAPHGARVPDHASVELEFLQFLAFREATNPDEPQVGDLRRAQRDFLDRHPCRWLPQASERLTAALGRREAGAGASFYRSVVELAADFVRGDRDWLDRVTGPPRQ